MTNRKELFDNMVTAVRAYAQSLADDGRAGSVALIATLADESYPEMLTAANIGAGCLNQSKEALALYMEADPYLYRLAMESASQYEGKHKIRMQ